MEDSAVKLFTAVLAANIFSAMFIYGMVKAHRMHDWNEMDFVTGLQIVIPSLMMAGGAYLYW